MVNIYIISVKCLHLFAEPPSFLEGESPANMNCTDGDTISIRCNTAAEPQSDVTWLRNGEPLNCECGITEALSKRTPQAGYDDC